MVFTGFRLDQLRFRNLPGVDLLLCHTDVVVDGPFVSARHETVRNWVGSNNQRFHYLTERYDKRIETSSIDRAAIEIRLEMDGSIEMNGFPLISV